MPIQNFGCALLKVGPGHLDYDLIPTVAPKDNWHISVALSDLECADSTAELPEVWLKARISNGDFGSEVECKLDANVYGKGGVQIAKVSEFKPSATVVYFVLSMYEDESYWQIGFKNQQGGDRYFVWVAANTSSNTWLPWIDVLGPPVDFGQVDDAKLGTVEGFRVGNRGTGTLQVNGIENLPNCFRVDTELPLDIAPGRSATIKIKPISRPSEAFDNHICTVQSNDSTPGHNNTIKLSAYPPPAPRLPTIDRFKPESLQQGETKPDFEIHGSNLNEMKLLRFYREEKWDWIQATKVSVSNDGFTFNASVTVKADAPTDKPYYTLKLLRGDDDPDPTNCATCATPFSVTPARPEDLTMTPNHGCLGTRLTNYTLGGKNLGNVKQVSFEPTGNITTTIVTPGQTTIGLELDIKEDAQIGDYDLILAPSGVEIVKAFRVESAATVDAIQPNRGLQDTTLPAFVLGRELSEVEGQIEFRQVGKTEDAPSIKASIAHFGDEVVEIPVNTKATKLAYDNEGRYLLALLADADGGGPAVRRYEFPQYKFCNQLPLGSEELKDCILSPTGGHFVTVRAGSPPLVELWDVTTGRKRKVLDMGKASDFGMMGKVTLVSVAFSPNGNYLAVGTIGGYRHEVGPDTLHRGLQAGHVGFDPDPGGLFYPAETGAVWLNNLTLSLVDIGKMEVKSTELSRSVKIPSSGGGIACVLAFSPDSICLAVSLRDQEWDATKPDLGDWHVALRHVPSLQPIELTFSQPGIPFSVGDTEVQRLAFSGRLLAARAGEDQWKIWEVATGVEVASMTDVTDLVFSPDGGRLAVARRPGSFPNVTFDWAVQMFHIAPPWLPSASPPAEIVSDTIPHLSDDTPKISLYGSISYSLDQPVTHLEFSPNGRYLLVNHGDDAEILGRKFGLAGASGELKIALALENLQPGIAFSPDGRYLVAATSSGLRTWLIKDGDDATLPVLITIAADASPGDYTFRLRNNKGVGFNKDVTFKVERSA